MAEQRYAGGSLSAIVSRFLAMEPKPPDVPQEVWNASQRDMANKLVEVLRQLGPDPVMGDGEP